MPIYRLEPNCLDDPRWQASSVSEALWIAAATPARARQLVAEQTFTPAQLQPQSRPLPSPWLSDALTSCALESWKTDVPVGTLMHANDPRVSGCAD
jgi:hypothetical protein